MNRQTAKITVVRSRGRPMCLPKNRLSFIYKINPANLAVDGIIVSITTKSVSQKRNC